MKLAYLKDIYHRPGPFVSVYLDTSADAEDAAKAIELRWRSAKEQLVDQGADEASLAAIENSLNNHVWRTGRRGQALVAAGGEVVLDDELPDPPTEYPSDEAAQVEPLPYLMPYLRLRGARIPHVIALVDHAGAEVTSVNSRRESDTVTVEGGANPLHKSSAAGVGNEPTHHRAVEEQWERNAERAADEITRQALECGADCVVLGGDVQQRALVRERLRKGVRERVVETDASYRDRNASEESLRREVDDAVWQALDARVSEVVERFERERGERRRAVEGWDATVSALRRGQVETLLWTPNVDVSADTTGKLMFGDSPMALARDESELTAMGETDPHSAPASAVVLRALAESDAELVLVHDDQVELEAGVGAVLRYSD